jgi:hypothetical protein
VHARQALFIYEFTVASWDGSFPVTKWCVCCVVRCDRRRRVLIPITVVSSFLSGYVSTQVSRIRVCTGVCVSSAHAQVYMCANRAVIKAYNGDTTNAKSVRSYVSLANQVGMLVGYDRALCHAAHNLLLVGWCVCRTYGCLLVSSIGIFTTGKD